MKSVALSINILEALEELRPILWPKASKTAFYSHPLYKVGVAPNSLDKLPLIFGDSFSMRLGLWWDFFRKGEWLKSHNSFLESNLPSDAIIFLRDNKKGLLVISAEENLALKLFFADEAKMMLDDEAKTLSFLGKSSFAPYSAKLINHGTTQNGARWLATSFCANTQPFKNPQSFFKKMEDLIMPAMTKFYLSSGVKTISIADWLSSAYEKADKFGLIDELRPLLTVIASEAHKYPEYKLPLSRIHHDLHIGNVLRHKNQIKVIDWEGCMEGPVLVDVFDFLRRIVHHDLRFWHYLADLKDHEHTKTNKVFEFYQRWSQDNFSIQVPNGSQKLTLFLYAAERALLLKEKRNINRFHDHSGFEYKVGQVCLKLC